MTDHLLSPDGKICVGGKEYVLNGSFKTLKAIQQVFGKDIIEVTFETRGMSFDDMAKLIAIGIGDGSPDPELIEQEIVETLGIVNTRQTVGAWLLMAITPKSERSQQAKQLAKALKK